MTDDLGDFYINLMQEVAASAEARGELSRTALVENLLQRLLAAEVIQDCTLAYYEGKGSKNRAIGTDAYSADELDMDGTLHVFVAEVRQGEGHTNLTTNDVKMALSRATSFVADAYAGKLHEALEPSTPAADLARLIHGNVPKIKTVRVVLLSNAALGARYKEVDLTSINSVKVELQVWDLLRFQQLSEKGGHEDVDIDLLSFTKDGLPALPTGRHDDLYSAYLCVVPGDILADIYDQFGSRLLEGNVRAFLSNRGKVNKGMRKTIQTRPESFFAFNNGIAATATAVEVEGVKDGHRLVRIHGLQIVNGGQTTASLYSAKYRDRTSLNRIHVQMKLSVLPPEKAEEMIPEISRYANTQNKVSEADLFANDPFHRRVEELSRAVWAPPKTGHLQTHWFYERARAQYQTEQFKRAPSNKKAFLLQNPKDQVITKTDLAKYENTWSMMPHVVSMGAQKNFSVYAEALRPDTERRPDDMNERWYQHLVAKAIVFKAAEGLVSGAPWYTGGYRANIVTYGVARFVKAIGDAFPEHVLDLDRIWKSQKVSKAIEHQVLLAAESAYHVLIAPPASWSNVTEWAKKEQCWDTVAASAVEVIPAVEADLKEAEEERQDRKDARAERREDRVVDAILDVVAKKTDGYWQRAAAWPETRQVLTPKEWNALRSAAGASNEWVPPDPVVRILVGVAAKLKEEGFD